MRLHRPLLALIVVFALTNVGLATFIAAAPVPLATVIIASASDDLPTPPPTPDPINPPSPQIVPSTGCPAALVVFPSASQPVGTHVPGAMKEIGRFALNYSTPAGCPTQSTDSAVVREITVAFQWSELSAIARRRAVVTQLELRSSDRSILYGKYPSVRASGNTTIRFIARVPRLDIPLAGVKEFVIIGNTTNVTGGNTSIVTLQAHVKRVIAELTMSGDVVASSLMYDGAPVAQVAAMTTGLDAASPSGIQTAGTFREVARFVVTSTRDAQLQTLRFRFESMRNGQPQAPPVDRVRYYVDEQYNRGPMSLNDAREIHWSMTNIPLTAGRPISIRVIADVPTWMIQPDDTLRADLVGITAKQDGGDGGLPQLGFDPLASPVRGNTLTY